MITGVIVVSSLLLAAAFLSAWVAQPDLRERIERPKHLFLDDLERYDRRCRYDRTHRLP